MGQNRPINTRPWKKPPWKRRRRNRGYWWAPATSENTDVASANPEFVGPHTSCYTQFTEMMDAGIILQIPILDNFEQGIPDYAIDELEELPAGSFPGPLPLDGWRHKPTSERFRVVRVVGDVLFQAFIPDEGAEDIQTWPIRVGMIRSDAFAEADLAWDPSANQDVGARWLGLWTIKQAAYKTTWLQNGGYSGVPFFNKLHVDVRVPRSIGMEQGLQLVVSSLNETVGTGQQDTTLIVQTFLRAYVQRAM